MEKTKQIGIRFPKDLLKFMEADGFANSPQKAINFLSDFYFKNRHNIIAYQKMISNTMLQVRDISPDGTVKATYDMKAMKKVADKPYSTEYPKIDDLPKDNQGATEITEDQERAKNMARIAVLEKELKSAPDKFSSVLAKQSYFFDRTKELNQLKQLI